MLRPFASPSVRKLVQRGAGGSLLDLLADRLEPGPACSDTSWARVVDDLVDADGLVLASATEGLADLGGVQHDADHHLGLRVDLGQPLLGELLDAIERVVDADEHVGLAERAAVLVVGVELEEGGVLVALEKFERTSGARGSSSGPRR